MAAEHKTIRWWRGMVALGLFNMVLWVVVVSRLKHEGPYVPWHVLFSGVFTAVCAFRSMLPRIDLERYCLLDSMASSMVIGRTGATLAEISFACQIALILHEAGNLADLAWVQMLAYPVVFSLTLAQVFCWSSVISLNHLGHTIEESLWGITFVPVGIALASCGFNLDGLWQTVCFAGAVFCAGYVAFMAFVDVPMYYRRWREGLVKNEKRLGFKEGFADALNRRVVTQDWAIWKPEVAWLTGYFSMAVWVSISLMVLPR
ncbi:MAG: hypothetical protein CMH56_01505 [Myxococcales bacterium]|nr:hypothetical protein [Myxococcales bacterium]|tara:strand:- start:150 stop:929 length:780 start_codon:yes stop_codon:yes gene_type:complete